MPSIFYSWQSDLPNNTNRGFIKQALEEAISHLNQEDIYEPDRGEFVLDHDTKGVAGSPSIDETIFRKIESSDIFVADISLIYRFSKKADENQSIEKHAPNPNVMLELGFAAHCLGWERLICICNTAYGTNLPFDLITKRVLRYNCPLDEENKAIKRRELSAQLNDAITTIAGKLNPTNRNQPATFTDLESFYQETVNSIGHPPGTPYQEVYMGPQDQHLLTLNVSQLEPMIQKYKVKIKQFGGFPFLSLESYIKKKKPKDGLIVYDEKIPTSHPYWKFQRNGFLYEGRQSLREGMEQSVFPIEWLLMDICQPIMFLNNFMNQEASISNDIKFKIVFKWFQTKGIILSYGNIGNFDRYRGRPGCDEENVEVETIFSKQTDLRKAIYELLSQAFHQFGREYIDETNRQPLDSRINKILDENIYPEFGR